MNEQIEKLLTQSAEYASVKEPTDRLAWQLVHWEKFAKLIIEETLNQVDEQCYGRGENQWYYDDDKRWIRLHFGYGELKK